MGSDGRPPDALRAEAGMLLALAALRRGELPTAAVRADEALRDPADVPAQVWALGAVVAALAGAPEPGELRLARARERLARRPLRLQRATVLLAEADLARARGQTARAREARARLEASGPPEPGWPEGAPPLAEHLRRCRWLVERSPLTPWWWGSSSS